MNGMREIKTFEYTTKKKRKRENLKSEEEKDAMMLRKGTHTNVQMLIYTFIYTYNHEVSGGAKWIRVCIAAIKERRKPPQIQLHSN